MMTHEEWLRFRAQLAEEHWTQERKRAKRVETAILAVFIFAILMFLGAVFLAAAALAAPPPPDSPLWPQLRPHKAWIEGQWIHCHNPPTDTCWCCNVADGRPVEAEEVPGKPGHWRAHVTPDLWPGVTDHWEEIDPAIHVQHSPFFSEGFLWRSPETQRNFCFAPPAGGV